MFLLARMSIHMVESVPCRSTLIVGGRRLPGSASGAAAPWHTAVMCGVCLLGNAYGVDAAWVWLLRSEHAGRHRAPRASPAARASRSGLAASRLAALSPAPTQRGERGRRGLRGGQGAPGPAGREGCARGHRPRPPCTGRLATHSKGATPMPRSCRSRARRKNSPCRFGHGPHQVPTRHPRLMDWYGWCRSDWSPLWRDRLPGEPDRLECHRPARRRQGVTPERLRPTTPARIRLIDTSLRVDTVSPRKAMPITAVPAAPMPVHTA